MLGTAADKAWEIRNQHPPSSVTIQRRTADQRASPDPVSHNQGGRYDHSVPAVPGALAALLAAHLTQASVGFQPVRVGPTAGHGEAVAATDSDGGLVMWVFAESWQLTGRRELNGGRL